MVFYHLIRIINLSLEKQYLVFCKLRSSLNVFKITVCGWSLVLFKIQVSYYRSTTHVKVTDDPNAFLYQPSYKRFIRNGRAIFVHRWNTWNYLWYVWHISFTLLYIFQPVHIPHHGYSVKYSTSHPCVIIPVIAYTPYVLHQHSTLSHAAIVCLMEVLGPAVSPVSRYFFFDELSWAVTNRSVVGETPGAVMTLREEIVDKVTSGCDRDIQFLCKKVLQQVRRSRNEEEVLRGVGWPLYCLC